MTLKVKIRLKRGGMYENKYWGKNACRDIKGNGRIIF